MKLFKLVLMSLMILSLVLSFAFAAGNVERGQALFKDPKLSGSTNDASCNTCHPDGKGLENAAMKDKKEWKTPVGVDGSLEDAINTCITQALKGKALDKKSQDMKDLVAYITSLGQRKHTPGY